MRPLEKISDCVSIRPSESVLPVLSDRTMDFIDLSLARGEKPEPIAGGLHPLFEIAPADFISISEDELPDLTQTERRQDKESIQFPADEEREPLFTRLPDGDTSDAINGATPSTQTGRRQDEEPAQLQPEYRIAGVSDGVRPEDPQATQTGRRQDEESEPGPAARGIAAVADGVRPEDPQATQTGRRQDRKKSVLTDEVKAFIVRRLAHYETPTRVAAAVKLEFGIVITRRQAFAYDPTGSRPPARRWIDLHAATRAKFLRDVAEIGIAQQVVRLRMLDRFARDAEDDFDTARAAKFLVLAAKECGGFYERTPRPKAAA